MVKANIDSISRTNNVELEKIEQAKRNNDHVFNRYNKYYVLSLENYYNDVNDILSNLFKEIDKGGD